MSPIDKFCLGFGAFMITLIGTATVIYLMLASVVGTVCLMHSDCFAIVNRVMQ